MKILPFSYCTVTWKTYSVLSPWSLVLRETRFCSWHQLFEMKQRPILQEVTSLFLSLGVAWIVTGLILYLVHLFFLRNMSFCRLSVQSVRDTCKAPCKPFNWGNWSPRISGLKRESHNLAMNYWFRSYYFVTFFYN